MLLPLSLEIVAADISLDDNEGAISEAGEEGGKTKNASCSELGEVNASCSEREGLPHPREVWLYILGWVAHGPR